MNSKNKHYISKDRHSVKAKYIVTWSLWMKYVGDVIDQMNRYFSYYVLCFARITFSFSLLIDSN